jgi:hypothetical protein
MLPGTTLFRQNRPTASPKRINNLRIKNIKEYSMKVAKANTSQQGARNSIAAYTFIPDMFAVIYMLFRLNLFRFTLVGPPPLHNGDQ